MICWEQKRNKEKKDGASVMQLSLLRHHVHFKIIIIVAFDVIIIIIIAIYPIHLELAF